MASVAKHPQLEPSPGRHPSCWRTCSTTAFGDAAIAVIRWIDVRYRSSLIATAFRPAAGRQLRHHYAHHHKHERAGIG